MSNYIPWRWAVGPHGAIARKEPLSWQRLEPHSRNSDFSNGIQATIYDPLWMLARQWQLGEFEGEDAGSPVFVKMDNREHKISKILQNNDKVFKYKDDMPLEVFVERTRLDITTLTEDGNTVPQLDLQIRVRLGVQFQREMDIVLKDIITDSNQLRKFKRYLAHDPDLIFDLNDKQNKFELEVTKKYISVIKDRVIDISRIIELDAPPILADKTAQYFIDNPIPNADPELPTKVSEALETAFNNLKNWWYGNSIATDPATEPEEAFFQRPPDNFSLWNPKQLEYNFKVEIAPEDTDEEKLVLDASEYKEDHLDWYSFTVAESTSGFQLPLVEPEEPKILPVSSNLKFSGMPQKRWWDFEDEYIDFGSLNPKKNNMVSLLLMEFGLVHSSDWYIIPHPMEVGTIKKIEKFTVKDCFGDKTVIEPAGRTSSELAMSESDSSWDSWTMFSLSEKYKDRDQKHNTPYFFLPPTIDHVLTGNPLEEIKMLRDETANLVWAVEKTYRTYYGEPISGYDHSLYLKRRSNVGSPLINETEEEDEDSDKPIKYTIMTDVSWNWIPFIPVHVTAKEIPSATTIPPDPSHKHIQLQRAAMINTVDRTPILPNSRLINEVQPQYYIDESEIPRSGIILSENCQRTVWYTGEVFLWIGRNKSIGTGEGSSGLQFDSISLRKKR
jgi:hypothetical protein